MEASEVASMRHDRASGVVAQATGGWGSLAGVVAQATGVAWPCGVVAQATGVAWPCGVVAQATGVAWPCGVVAQATGVAWLCEPSEWGISARAGTETGLSCTGST